MLKLIKKGEKLENQDLAKVKGGCGSVNPCFNCGTKAKNQATYDENYGTWFWAPIW